MFTQGEVLQNFIGVGQRKASMAIPKMLILAILAGINIALAGVAANAACATIENASVAKLVSALVFPGGLAMVVILGSELFTGNSLMVMSLMERGIKVSNMLKNWVFVYIGNLVGSIFIAWVVAYSHQLSLYGNKLAGMTINTAVAKTSISFGDALLKGILCNALVCFAVLMASAAKDVMGKIIGLFFPIMLFVVSGFEHSVANMYYIPAGLFALSNPDYVAAATADTSNLTWGSFFANNLLPVTLGNIIGGVVIAALIFWYCNTKKENKQ